MARAVATLETEDGKRSVKGPNKEDSYNLFNIKGKGFEAKDNMLGTVSTYRVYNSRKESIEDFMSLIERKYPKAYEAMQNGDGQAFAVALKEGGYAEDPSYVAKLTSVMSRLSKEN